jgi:translocator protein
MNKRQTLILVASLLIPLAVGALGGIATASSVTTWYATLAKPSFNPPSWVFGPVWTTLYLMMGVSLFFVWRRDSTPERNRALVLFGVQLALNFAWSFLFFAAERPDLALVNIVLLDVAIFATIHVFRPLSRPAAAVLVPYLLWCLFATVLNGAIWNLN